MLRDYQQRTIDQLYKWFSDGRKGHPCIELPTGSGKSHIVAALCKEALQTWPETRILMLTHVKELIEQNAGKMRDHWPNAPLGIYSAGMRRRDIGEPITFAGIQSVRNKADQIGHVDLVLIDECHLVSHKQEGGYRKLIDDLTSINPALRVIGLTATPYRMGHGYITDEPALFSDIIAPVSIEELIFKGFLAPLRSKLTAHKLSVDGVHKRGGEYIESELQAAVDTDDHNVSVVDEVISLAGDRRSWLFFCAGVKHAHNVADILNARGISAACIVGETPKAERERIIAGFRSGEIRALTNANVLTTGFDHPDLDLIAMLRPTLSTGLYVQMAGRGMRPKSHTDHCMVLDFAGVVQTHGPITAVNPKKPSGKGEGEAPVKVCEACKELNHISAKECIACGEPFPEPKPAKQNSTTTTSWGWMRPR
jgi:DNA repair protein RadD